MILEKGKGLVLGKLRIMQLIETDMQLLMRIFVNARNKFRMKRDNQIVKSNYRLRSYYLIENAILEKQLVHDNSMLIGEYNIYNTTNLQVHHNRQLSKIGLIVEESVRVK